MGNDSYPLKLTGTGTTTIGSAFLFAICVNKTLTGTLTINEQGSAVGQMAIATATGQYHNLPSGGRYSLLTIVLSAGDDVTVYIKKA